MMVRMAEPEQELATAASRGDRSAMDQLVQRLYRPVCALAFRLLGRRDDPREVAQETFSRVARHIGDFDPRKPFSSWVFAIAANAPVSRSNTPCSWSSVLLLLMTTRRGVHPADGSHVVATVGRQFAGLLAQAAGSAGKAASPVGEEKNVTVEFRIGLVLPSTAYWYSPGMEFSRTLPWPSRSLKLLCCQGRYSTVKSDSTTFESGVHVWLFAAPTLARSFRVLVIR